MKKINKKGFTLVELLAVIVILAVLILLAMPSVLRIMDNARKSAFETEVRSYLKAAQTKYAELAIDNNRKTFYFTSSGDEYSEEYDCSDGKECLLDNIENKDKYKYFIKIDVSSGSATYEYYITNSTYQASSYVFDEDYEISSSSSKTFNDNISVEEFAEDACINVGYGMSCS